MIDQLAEGFQPTRFTRGRNITRSIESSPGRYILQLDINSLVVRRMMELAWQAWVSLGVVITCIGLLSVNRYAPDLVLMAGLSLLLLTGVLEPEQALAGFANEGVLTVGVLYLVVSGLRETGAMSWVSQSLLGRPKSITGAQARLMVPVSLLSAFLNNTPVVAMFIPAVQDWAKRNRLSVSKLLIPLSYASIAGGTCTLIGTSTNLVVNGLIRTETQLPGLGMFSLAWIGIPLSLGVLFGVVLLSRRLLPDRCPMLGQLADPREYTIEMILESGSQLEGKSIEEAGLRQLPGVYLVEIDRDGRVIPAVSPLERLQGGDRLIFAGVVESVVDLLRTRGLNTATDQIFKLDSPRHERCLVEAVLSNSFPLMGKSVREGRFRNQYNAAVIAVARNGQRIRKKIGDIVLRPGDTLLLETHHSFVRQHRNSRDFLLLSRLNDSQPPRHDRAWIAIVIMALMVVSAAIGWLSLLEAAILATGLMLISRATSGSIARRAIDWQVLVVIAASLGIGKALETSGAATHLADAITATSGGGAMTALTLVFLSTALLTAVATNNAAAVIMFPIAMATAKAMSVDPMAFAVTIMIAASASYATPIGYQTNLMVFGPGGYRFGDYLRLGLPLTVLTGVITLLVVPWIWPL